MSLYLKLLCLTLILCQPIKAVFTYGNHLSKGKQNIYFFHDIHESYEKAPEQQISVVSFAKQINAKLFTEEMTDTQTLQKYIKDKHLLAQIGLDCAAHLENPESKLFPLRGLALFGRSQGVDAQNLDYRQWVDAFRSGKAITGKVAMQVLDQIIAEIKHYDDGPILNEYYKESVALVTGDIFKPLWDFLRAHEETVAQLAQTEEFKAIIKKIDSDPRKQELQYSNYWVAYDSILFDCLLLHRLVQESHKDIIVCAGGYHCRKAAELLEQCGFVKIYGCGQEGLYPTPMNMQGFVQKTLRQKYTQCITVAERETILEQETAAVIESNKKILALPKPMMACHFIGMMSLLYVGLALAAMVLFSILAISL